MTIAETLARVRRLVPFLAPPPAAGRMLSLVSPPASAAERIAKNNYLVGFAKVVTSQDGEDGVIDEILRRLGISQGWCVEFGAYDGKSDSNTWNLIHNRGWKGVLIEPLPDAFQKLKKNCEGLPDVYCFDEPVGWEGETRLDAIFARTPLPRDFDFMVVDIDGNDFYVWQACKEYRPKVVMIEFNPFIEADIYFVKPAEEDARASASLRAMYELAKTKDYELVCVVGGNAVFVRKEDYALFEIADNRPESMFQSRWPTKIFQGYDGTLMLAGSRRLVWKHQIDRTGVLNHVEVADADIQVLPEGLRVFRPRLTYRNTFLEEHAASLDEERVPSNRLLAFRANVTSECGEDGILARIFKQLGVGVGYCVDVGAADGIAFSSTRSLIADQGWRGLLVESDAVAHASLASLYRDKAAVKVVKAEVTTSGRNSLERTLKGASVPRDFDFLCIDVEGNDYHLWKSLKRHVPKVVMIEFNPTVSNDVLFAQEDSTVVNHGASLRALIELGRSKGYDLAAVTSWNAIFVRSDVFPKLGIADNDIDSMYYPVFETRIFHSINCYMTIQGCDRLVRHNYVIDPDLLQPLPPDVREIPFMSYALGKLTSTFFKPDE